MDAKDWQDKFYDLLTDIPEDELEYAWRNVYYKLEEMAFEIAKYRLHD